MAPKLRVMNHLDEVQRELQHLKGKADILNVSLFVQDIQEELLPTNFRLLILEVFDGNSNSVEHTLAFRAQMLLYSMLDALMYRTFPMTLREST